VALEGVAGTLYEAEEHAPEEIALQAEEYGRLRATVQRLPVLQQEILRLRFADGLRCAQIATLLEKREVSVRVALARTLNRLRIIYTKQ